MIIEGFITSVHNDITGLSISIHTIDPQSLLSFTCDYSILRTLEVNNWLNLGGVRCRLRMYRGNAPVGKYEEIKVGHLTEDKWLTLDNMTLATKLH